jgi:hypothetical protein
MEMYIKKYREGNSRIHSDFNHARTCHSRESGNPEKHLIPDQVRNDRPNKTYVLTYNADVCLK